MPQHTPIFSEISVDRFSETLELGLELFSLVRLASPEKYRARVRVRVRFGVGVRTTVPALRSGSS